MNFLELCQRTRQECGIQGEGPASVTNQTGLLKRVINWVADADNLVQSLHPDWNFLWREFTENTIAGVDTIVKPNDLGLWDRESFATGRGTVDGRPITCITYNEWRKINNSKSQQAPSLICVLPNGNLSFTYPPDDVYPFYGNYWASPVALTTNTQESAIPTRFERIIVARAKMWFFEDIESYDQKKLAEDEYEKELAVLEKAEIPDNGIYGQHSPEQLVVRPA